MFLCGASRIFSHIQFLIDNAFDHIGKTHSLGSMTAVPEEVLDKVRAGMRGLQPPGHYDKVYKDECMYSFDTPESPGGLYVNLKSFQVSAPATTAADLLLHMHRCRCLLDALSQLQGSSADQLAWNIVTSNTDAVPAIIVLCLLCIVRFSYHRQQ